MRRILITAALIACAIPAFAQMPTVTLALRDHKFAPAEVPVPAGVRVELMIHNAQATPAEFESTSLHREKVIPPGAKASVYVGPLDPGRYEFFDDFHPTTRGFIVVK